MACGCTDVSRDGLISQPVTAGRPNATLNQAIAPPDPGAVRAAAVEADRELARVRQALSGAPTPTVLGKTIESAQRAAIDARRKGVPEAQLRELERALRALNDERDRRISEEIREKLKRAERAAQVGNAPLAAVLNRRAKTLTYTVGGKSEKNNTDSGGVGHPSALDDLTIQRNREYVEKLRATGKVVGLTSVKEEIQYQVSVLNSFVEYEVGLPGGPRVIADGFDVATGFLQDAKFARDASSWYDPPSMNSPAMVDLATQETIKRLAAYKEVIDSSTNPFRGLEIVTTDEAAAKFFGNLMREIGLPGRVRIE